jgi:hypothetical protein
MTPGRTVSCCGVGQTAGTPVLVLADTVLADTVLALAVEAAAPPTESATATASATGTAASLRMRFMLIPAPFLLGR